MSETRVLVVGLDGGTFKKLGPWLDKNELPILSSLYASGCHANLRTFFPTLSPLEWACFYTGKSPGKLGLFALSHVEDLKNPLSSWHFIDSSVVKAKSLWKILSEQGITVGVANIPATYPVEKVNGFLISGYLTPPSATDFYYPDAIKEYLQEYKIESDFEYLPDKTVQTDSLLAELHSIAERRTDALVKIMQSMKIRFLAVNFKEIDTLQHVFWEDDSTLLKFVKSVDTMIGRLMNELHPTHVIVMSDHGFHNAESEYFYINTWLKQKGLLKDARGVTGRFWGVAYRLAVALSKRSRFIREIVLARKESAARYASLQIDLDNSKVYASQWGIFFSSSMRSQPDYDAVRQRIRDELVSMISPTGYRVFDHVFTREELFEGEFLDRFPDLIPVPSPRFLINPNLYDKTFDKRFDRPYLKGAHKSDNIGVFIFSGEGVKGGIDLDTVSITDIAPTVLFLFGIKPPLDMDGRIVEEAISQEFLEQLKPNLVSNIDSKDETKEKKTYTDEEQEQVMEQLRKLGYI